MDDIIFLLVIFFQIFFQLLRIIFFDISPIAHDDSLVFRVIGLESSHEQVLMHSCPFPLIAFIDGFINIVGICYQMDAGGIVRNHCRKVLWFSTSVEIDASSVHSFCRVMGNASSVIAILVNFIIGSVLFSFESKNRFKITLYFT